MIKIFLACIIAVILHEVSHILAARILKVKLYDFRPTPIGIKARLKENPKSFKKQAAIFFAGPLGNFIIAIIFFNSSGFLHNLFEANLAIGIFNLLPVYPLDGSQIFIIVLYKLIGSTRTFKLVKLLSVIMKISLTMTGLIQIIFFYNPSFLIAALFLPTTKVIEEKMRIMKLENFLNRKQRILKKKIYAVRHIVAMHDCTLGELINKLDYDRFHIIYVLNDDLDI
ncbi:MAG: hypothetical protein GX957_04760, partial [Clostridiaceae bacterium]|nr:hypothetical protein [Clostridiaceae bacterium]